MSIGYKEQKAALMTVFEQMRIFSYLGEDNSFSQEHKEYRKRLTAALDSLEPPEKFIVQERYLKEGLKDHQVYNQMGISAVAFSKIRRSAFNRLAAKLGIEVDQREETEEDDV